MICPQCHARLDWEYQTGVNSCSQCAYDFGHCRHCQSVVRTEIKLGETQCRSCGGSLDPDCVITSPTQAQTIKPEEKKNTQYGIGRFFLGLFFAAVAVIYPLMLLETKRHHLTLGQMVGVAVLLDVISASLVSSSLRRGAADRFFLAVGLTLLLLLSQFILFFHGCATTARF